jgi:hypothetical protein
MSTHAPSLHHPGVDVCRRWFLPPVPTVSSLLLHLAGVLLLLNACNVLPGDYDEAQVAVRERHLDGGGVRAGGGCRFGTLFGGGLAILVRVG